MEILEMFLSNAQYIEYANHKAYKTIRHITCLFTSSQSRINFVFYCMTNNHIFKILLTSVIANLVIFPSTIILLIFKEKNVL